MKKILLSTILLLLGITSMAQDVITTKDGNDIQAKILEVTTTEVKYKRFSNPNGPTFTISKNDVLIVKYENGEKEVFKDTPKTNSYKPNTTEKVSEGLNYSQYKDFYDKRYYVSQPGDPYSPGWAGVASFFIPGLGQGVAGEWGRAAWMIGVNIGLGIVTILSQQSFTNYITYYNRPFPLVYFASLAGRLAFGIWTITDAVKIAKIKNMYNQDIRGLRTAELHFSVSPFVTPTQLSENSTQAVMGLSLTLSF